MKIKSFQTRTVTIDEADKAHAEASPFIPMSLSSETPVGRSFGDEILLHGPENIDLSRAANGLPLIVSHDATKLPIGRLRNIHIDPETKKLRGEAYFSDRPEAQAIRKDILAGFVTDVSVGYKIKNHRVERSTSKDEPNKVFVTRWLPVEGSVCAHGADPNAGFGRSEEMDQEIELDMERKADPAEDAESKPTEGDPAEKPADPETGTEEAQEPSEKKEKEPLEEEGETDPKREDTTETEKRGSPVVITSEEVKALRTVALNLKFRSESEVDAILSGAPDLESARAQLLKPPTSNTRKSYEEIPMTYDPKLVTRGLHFALRGQFDKIDESLAGVFSKDGERSIKADLFDTLNTRAGEMTTASKGTATIYDQNIGFLEILRARAAVLKAGAKTRTGSGAMSYVRQKAAVAATLRGENTGTTAATSADFEKVSYTPHAVTAKVFLTDELQKESPLALLNILKGDMVKQFGLGIDGWAINGAASPAITGLLSAATITSGLYNKDLGTAAKPTWATLNALKGAVDAKAVDLESCAWLLTPDLMALLESTAKFTNGSVAICEGEKINGRAAYSSSNVPIATLNHTALFGDFSNLEICLQGPTEFMIDIQSRFDEGITILTARQYFDIGVLQPSAFAKCANFLVA